MKSMHYTSGSHSSTSAPSISYSTSVLFSDSWVDTGGYAKITSISSTQIKVKVYRSSNHDFSNVYRMTFRFYSERVSPNSCNDVTFVSSRYSDNHNTETDRGAESRYFWVQYNFYSTNGNSWPYWYGGDYYEFTFTFSSTGGDSTDPAIYFFVHSTITWEKSIYHHDDYDKCGCCG